MLNNNYDIENIEVYKVPWYNYNIHFNYCYGLWDNNGNIAINLLQFGKIFNISCLSIDTIVNNIYIKYYPNENLNNVTKNCYVKSFNDILLFEKTSKNLYTAQVFTSLDLNRN